MSKDLNLMRLSSQIDLTLELLTNPKEQKISSSANDASFCIDLATTLRATNMVPIAMRVITEDFIVTL